MHGTRARCAALHVLGPANGYCPYVCAVRWRNAAQQAHSRRSNCEISANAARRCPAAAWLEVQIGVVAASECSISHAWQGTFQPKSAAHSGGSSPASLEMRRRAGGIAVTSCAQYEPSFNDGWEFLLAVPLS